MHSVDRIDGDHTLTKRHIELIKHHDANPELIEHHDGDRTPVEQHDSDRTPVEQHDLLHCGAYDAEYDNRDTH